MSVQPMGLPGYPTASAIGLGMAMTSGVTMNGCPVPTIAGWLVSERRWLTMPPHDVAAGDQITGLGPSVASFQFVYSSCAAAPDDFLCGRTNTQWSPCLAAGDVLNALAMFAIRSD